MPDADYGDSAAAADDAIDAELRAIAHAAPRMRICALICHADMRCATYAVTHADMMSAHARGAARFCAYGEAAGVQRKRYVCACAVMVSRQ